MDHVHQFVLAELGTEGSIAGDGQLVLKGKYGPKNIESLLRKYISISSLYSYSYSIYTQIYIIVQKLHKKFYS